MRDVVLILRLRQVTLTGVPAWAEEYQSCDCGPTHSRNLSGVAARSGDPPDRRLYLQSRVSATDGRRPLMLATPNEAGYFESTNPSGFGLRRIAQSFRRRPLEGIARKRDNPHKIKGKPRVKKNSDNTYSMARSRSTIASAKSRRKSATTVEADVTPSIRPTPWPTK